MSHPPTVSVLMAVYNSERYVAKAVDSILTQTWQDFEFIIIDDGSTDDSFKILHLYAAKDQRIRLFQQENRGIPQTRNELLAKATGEFVALMDSDDIALPERIALQVDFLQQHPNVVCVGGAYQLIDDANRLILNHFAMPTEDEEIQRLMLAGHVSLHQPCVMFRREAAILVGGYNENMIVGEDLDLWLRLGELDQLANLKEAVLQYRLHRQSISEKQQAFALDKLREACEDAWKRRGIDGAFEVTVHWRPGKDRRSRHLFMLQYGWWAFQSGQRRTALIYGIQAIKLQPFAIAGWKLLAVAILKPLPEAP